MPARSADQNVRLLYAYWFLRDFQLWIPVWIVFLTLERGFSLTQVTSAEGLFLVGVIVLEVPTGAVADRWGRSRSLGLGALALGLAVLIFAFTTSFPVLLASFLTWSLAQALMSGADAALLYETLHANGDDGRYERFLGRGAAINWGAAGLATLLGGPVAAALDIRATILIGAATCLVCSAVAFSLWEPPHRRQGKRAGYFASIRAAFREAWQTTDVRRVILLFGTAEASIQAAHYVVQPYLLDRGIEVGVVFSLLQVPMIFAGALGALLSSRVQGRAGAIGLLLSVPLIAVGAYVTLAAAPGLWAYAALPLLFGLGSTMLPVASGFVNRRIGSEQRATVLSIQGMATSLVLAVLAPMTGFVTDRWGLRATFTVGGSMTLVAVAVFGAPLLGSLRRTEAGLPAAADI